MTFLHRSHHRLDLAGILIILMAAFAAGSSVYRYAASYEAMATVVEVRPYCEVVHCSWGKCNQRERISCTDTESFRSQGKAVVLDREARLEFVGPDGVGKATWARLRRLGRIKATAGETMTLHFLGRSDPEVIARPSFHLTVIGVIASIALAGFGSWLVKRSRTGQGLPVTAARTLAG